MLNIYWFKPLVSLFITYSRALDDVSSPCGERVK